MWEPKCKHGWLESAKQCPACKELAVLQERIAELEDQNKSFRAAQKACEHCDGPTMAQVAAMRISVERFVAAVALYNQSPFDRIAIRKYDEAKRHVQGLLGIEA